MAMVVAGGFGKGGRGGCRNEFFGEAGEDLSGSC